MNKLNFSVDYNIIDNSNINIHKYLMEKHRKYLFIKKLFTGLLKYKVNASNHTNGVSLNNQQCMTQPNLINLHPIEYNQGLRY